MAELARTAVLTRKLLPRTWRPVRDRNWFLARQHGLVCGHLLLEVFDVPDKAQKAEFVAYDRPSKNRVAVKVIFDPSYPKCPDIKIDGRRYYMHLDFARRYLLPFIGKTIYVEMEWE